MRPQDDYLREFAVLMTEKGVVAVSDPQQIAVYDYLCGGSRRPLDIAEDLGMPSSTLHFILDKMVDSGIISRSKPDPSRKEVYYTILAHKLVGSTTPSPRDTQLPDETLGDHDGGRSGLSSVADMLESYTAEIGLDLSQMRARYARDLAAAVKDDIGTGTIESVMPAVKERFCAITGFRLSVFGLNPPTLIFEGDPRMASKMDMLTALVRCMLENATGRPLEVRSSEDLSVEGSVRFKVAYERSEPEPEPYVNTSLPQMAEPEKFLVLEIDGRVALLMNDIQTQLVDAIYERPLCVTDVVNMVNMPRSTVTTNLLRMVEEGIASVFYSESGGLYYGLSCSILMKRVRRMSKDQAPIREAVKAAVADGAFMEGYLKYLLASFQVLGFETDYLMVVLGAKYMRAAGRDGPKNFDFYFGKMSDMARVFGLALSVVSVYPLTIGISRSGDGSVTAPAMTFVKGMAHQGLEMASSGIFVRVSEETPDDMKVSFKEIYPSLSMTPAAGADGDASAEALPAKKKRTSSVRDALRNRSAKSDGRPVRTMRYITSVAMAVFAVVIVLVAVNGAGTDNIASAETYTLDVDAEGVYIVDADGNAIDTPYVVNANETLTFSVANEGDSVVGIVRDGMAIPLERLFGGEGTYTVTMTSDMVISELRQVIPANGLSVYIYDFGTEVERTYAYNFDGYYSAVEYISVAGALWATEDAYVMYVPAEGGYVSLGEDDPFFLEVICAGAWEDVDASSRPLTEDYVVLDLVGAYEVDGYYVEGSLRVAPGEQISLRFVSTDGPVVLLLEQDGRETSLTLSLDRAVTFAIDSDATIVYQHTVVQ